MLKLSVEMTKSGTKRRLTTSQTPVKMKHHTKKKTTPLFIADIMQFIALIVAQTHTRNKAQANSLEKTVEVKSY